MYVLRGMKHVVGEIDTNRYASTARTSISVFVQHVYVRSDIDEMS
jgi:hypothetical protein